MPATEKWTRRWSRFSLVLDDKSRYSIVDPQLYTPVDEVLIVCGKDPARVAAARTFAAFIGSPRAAQILKKHALEPLAR